MDCPLAAATAKGVLGRGVVNDDDDGEDDDDVVVAVVDDEEEDGEDNDPDVVVDEDDDDNDDDDDGVLVSDCNSLPILKLLAKASAKDAAPAAATFLAASAAVLAQIEGIPVLPIKFVGSPIGGRVRL